jgi:hypothetical protein
VTVGWTVFLRFGYASSDDAIREAMMGRVLA